MLSIEQLELRKKGIGGTDAAAILGINPYKTAMEVWLEKTGRLEREQQEGSQFTYWGHVLEDVVAREYSKITNLKVKKVNSTLFHPEVPWLLANIDRKVIGQPKVLECKTTSAYREKDWGASGTDHVPEEYIVQVQHYLAVTGYLVADLAVLIGGNDFRIYTIPRDDALINQMIRMLSDFWQNNVLADMPPQPSSRLESSQLWPKDNRDYIDATDDHILLIDELKNTKKEITALEQKKNILEGEITNLIGNAAGILAGDKKLISWKANKHGSRIFKLY